MKNNLFAGIEDQNLAINILTEVIHKNKIAPGYLFSGPQGVGQRIVTLRFLEGLITGGDVEPTIRKRLESLNHPDLLWVEPSYISQGRVIKQSLAQKDNININAISKIRLDQIKELKTFLGKRTIEAKLAMVVIEDAEKMNEAASNALLKTLEEVNNGLIILISSRSENLLSTIKSRCHEIPFKPLKYHSLEELFINYGEDNKINNYTFDSRKELINLSNGSPELLIRNINKIQEIPSEILLSLTKLPNDYLEAITIAKDIIENLDIEQQLWIINFLQQHFWLRESNLYCMNVLKVLSSHLVSSIQPRIAWEVALIELTSQNYKDC
ncbi:DNA polymerase III subunit delta' [Prochlorococcus marinus]|uniref:DNA polymerase III, delta prime subunit n=1 Tax=Prochlorococcus marinus (strain MIT 9211) TaxID=93059 RepID=A9BCY6_PROM4|nr:DNA polymerase III subunit delta' [Prochlorococcus marinus]ABX08074.1 DNA polymerase III, delta prime subunit [Prochlorococcus marinus str. MIT 9211]